ncbi:phosphatidylinositol 3- and 4-kinase family protein [Gregarina niphandrodes]|uniref:Phosphatidylinositol 3- and 4-kinase family protein n=1 Tax=Gregarina niphandrodes TaxID=110365 RepID=A0A023BAQ3_GRENI|nr:phosphatidylinositol 3- and 4-kinase family protein [Gregarina niphandrodes]EZG78452.1 phosphatidylinositol 3- and 4-kinase family protein [Gregarina niphandrodes]|eukprot:XP_011129300.1 phosphatidylinositol 3- and 4-kinase family protein [Gregarina niphandrodes]
MAHYQAFSEVHIEADLDQELAFTITLELIDDNLAGAEKEMMMRVFPFHDVELLKRMLLKRLKNLALLKISDLQFYHNGVELKNRRLLITFANLEKPVFQWKVKEKLGKHLVIRGIRQLGGMKLPSRHINWLQQINACLQAQVNPKLTDEGTGSTYILCNQINKPIGVFKPTNEEAFTPFNPRGYIGKMGQKGFREGVVSGEGSAREVAAYLLDAYYGSLSNVPVTIMAEAIHPHFCYDPNNPRKTRGDDLALNGLFRRKKRVENSEPGIELVQWKSGSLQQFVNARETCGDYDPSVFSVADVHKIAILDIRLCNMDRNDGNILVVRQDQLLLDGKLADSFVTAFLQQHAQYQRTHLLTPEGKQTKYRLIPIDHGLTLPDCFDITDLDLAWINWPQSHIGFSPDELEYIERLRPDKDAEWVAGKLDIRPECLRTMQVSTRLLKRAAKLGMTLHQIALLMVRLSPNQPSPLEKLVKLALSQAWYACYASHLVHKRASEMSCVMDLATPTAIPHDTETSLGSGRHQKLLQLNEDVLHRHTSVDDSIGSSSAKRPRSKTVVRNSRSTTAEETLQKTANRLRNFTSLRARVDQDNMNYLWTIEDVGGRIIYPDWDDPTFLK